MLYNVLLIVQILIALSIIGLVLIQHGKGADAGAAFGGGASGTVFGSKGSGNFLSRSTAVLAALFFANSLFLAWLTAHPDTLVEQSVVPVSVTDTVPGSDAKQSAAPDAVAVPSDVPLSVAPSENDSASDAGAKPAESDATQGSEPADVPTQN